jgi:metallo-beta-lactamase family protein
MSVMLQQNISIRFLGAAGTVTGSKHLLKTPEKNILIDCGLFQGIKSLRLKNREPFPVDISTIDTLILTHAHLDHCGYIPLLVKSGFKGKILMTPPTRARAEIILRDSARIQEEDAERANREGFSKHHPALPLYNMQDVEQCLRNFEICEDNTWVSISPGIRFRFIKNGHILGSAFVDIECFGKKIVFSGDMGREYSTILHAPQQIDVADILVLESTYGDRNHSVTPAADTLAETINDTLRDKGNLLIPSFAVGRAQELMHIISQLKKEIRIPDVPVFMDSPMGADATIALHKYSSWHKLSSSECNAVCKDIHIITDFADTQRIIREFGSKVVIAASGMLTGGRVLEYLKYYIGDKRNTVLLVGYQTEGTRGRALKEGAQEIKMHGKYYPVKAQVKEITSLSAHADQREMLSWLSRFTSKPKKIFLVHGEPQAQEVFRVKIKDELKTEVIIPGENEELQV